MRSIFKFLFIYLGLCHAANPTTNIPIIDERPVISKILALKPTVFIASDTVVNLTKIYIKS